jgi:hypothetical protein
MMKDGRAHELTIMGSGAVVAKQVGQHGSCLPACGRDGAQWFQLRLNVRPQHVIAIRCAAEDKRRHIENISGQVLTLRVYCVTAGSVNGDISYFWFETEILILLVYMCMQGNCSSLWMFLDNEVSQYL